eukprot:scaffold2858_cov659-Pavlova_lutheri.AAC.166
MRLLALFHVPPVVLLERHASPVALRCCGWRARASVMWLVSVAIRSNASVERSILERICTPGPFRPGLPPKLCPMRAWPDEDEVDRSRRVGGSRSPRGILPPTHPHSGG